MSSSPRLLAGRNLTLGKPAHYVRLEIFNLQSAISLICEI